MILKVIFWTIVLIAFVSLTIFFLWWGITTLSDEGNSPFISFKLVKTGYELNPKRWEWDNMQPSIGVETAKYTKTWFRLHFIDWIKAFFFFNKIKGKKLEKENQDKIIEVLEIVQKDAELLIKKSQQEQEEAMKEMKKVANNFIKKEV